MAPMNDTNETPAADERPRGYTAEQVERGDYPPILSLLSPELAAEVAAARIGGEPLHVPRLRLV